jgi:hypothetical protein
MYILQVDECRYKMIKNWKHYEYEDENKKFTYFHFAIF